jgi:hypothetical protein
MNKYTAVSTLQKLAVAEEIIAKISRECKYPDIMSAQELVALKLAVMDARLLVQDEILDSIKIN